MADRADNLAATVEEGADEFIPPASPAAERWPKKSKHHHQVTTMELKDDATFSELRKRGKSADKDSGHSKAPAVRGGVGDLLEEKERVHRAYAVMHNEAARQYGLWHRWLTISILIVALVTTLVSTGLMGVSSPFTNLVDTLAIAAIAGVTAINNFLDFSGLAKDHIHLKLERVKATRVIERALALRAENPKYDFRTVLAELDEITNVLMESPITIPHNIAKNFPEYEMPWLIRESLEIV